MYPGQCTFAIQRPTALAIGKRRGKRVGVGCVHSVVALFFLLYLLPVLCPARIPLPATPGKWQSREMLSSRDLSRIESGKTGAIYLMGGLGSRCCGQQCASGNEEFWRTNSILSLLLSFHPQYQVRCQGEHLKPQKEKLTFSPSSNPQLFYKLNGITKGLFWYPCGRRFKCWSRATALMNWDSWNKSSLAHVKFPCVSFVWAMHLSHKLASFWLVNLEEILDWQSRRQVRQSGG